MPLWAQTILAVIALALSPMAFGIYLLYKPFRRAVQRSMNQNRPYE